MRWLVVALLLLHGLIHFMGPAKAFGWAELETLSRPISRGMGVVWLLAGVGFLCAALLLLRSPRGWYWVALASVVVSQVAVASAWSDARFGTVANLLVLLAALHGLAAHGPWSLRAEYREAVAERLGALEGSAPPVGPPELGHLPGPVRRYLEVVGAADRPLPIHVRATWEGRIRGGPDEPWMEFTAEQHNFPGEPSRFFLMDAVRGGLPVDVLHTYREGRARMRVRLLSLVPLVDARGPELDRAETVTLLNDLALLSPGALADPALSWEPVDDTTAQVRYQVADERVSALLRFDADTGELVDFVSDDRLATSPDGTFVPMRWSTPVEGYRDLGGRRAFTRGVGLWHPDDGEPWPYFEAELTGLEVEPD